MKRLSLLLTLIVLISLNAMAQESLFPSKIDFQVTPDMKKAFHPKAQVRDDTLLYQNFLECDTFYSDYQLSFPNTLGYIFGHNYILDSAHAENFQGIEGDKIVGVWLFFADASATSSLQKIHVKLWDDDGVGGSPGTELASVDVTQQSIVTDVANGDLTFAMFATAVNMPAGGNFYVGFKQDYKIKQGHMVFDSARSVALGCSWAFDPDATVINDCSDDSIENTAWNLSSKTFDGVGAWHPIFDIWTFDGNPFALRSIMGPLVTSAAACSITINPSSSSICKGKSVVLTASGATTYSWAPSTGLNCTTCASVTAKPGATTTYTVTGDGGACSATVKVTVNKVTANVAPSPCSGGAVLLTRTGTPTTGVTFKWYKDNVVIPGATASTYSATSNGAYKVKVTQTSTGCSKTSKPVTVTILCKEGVEFKEFDASAYPNPFTQSMSLNIATGSSETATVVLLDYTGRTIREFRNVDVNSPLEINENLNAGVYFVKVLQGKNEKMLKVVKSD